MRVYYTGDMANNSGWFVASVASSDVIVLNEELGGEDRRFVVSPRHIGDVYEGHCNPRFVTEAAYNAYRARRFAGAR